MFDFDVQSSPDCDKNNFNKIRYGMIVYFAKTNGLTIYTVMNPNQHFDDLEFAIAHYLNVKKVILNFDDKVKSNEKIASTELKFIFESDYKNLIMELYGTQNGTNNHNITQNV